MCYRCGWNCYCGGGWHLLTMAMSQVEMFQKFRFLSLHRRNLEMREKLRKKSEDLFKWETHLFKRGKLLPCVSLALLVIRSISLCEQTIHWEGGVGGGGSYSLIFISAPTSQREERFLSLFSFHLKCPGIGAWWVLLIGIANFIIILL